METHHGYGDYEGAGSSFLFGFAMGIVGGAAAALLYAPKEGRQVRSYLAERARDGRQRAAEMAERSRDMMREGRHALDQGKEMISTALHEGKEAYRRTKTGTAGSTGGPV
jgi:gas vesicle protein